MKMVRIEIYVRDEVDPHEFARRIYDNWPKEVAELSAFALRIPFKKAWHVIEEVCDTCGDLVDQTEGGFKKHNEDNYERHVRISRDDVNYPNVSRIF